MVDKFNELFEELKELREPLLRKLKLTENEEDRNISGETIFLNKKELIILINLSNKYDTGFYIMYLRESKDDFDRLIISFSTKDKKKKTIEEKRLDKLNKIFAEIKEDHFKPHPELRDAMFDKGIPICTMCGFLMENTYDNITKKKSPYLWKCVNTKCKRPKNIVLSVG